VLATSYSVQDIDTGEILQSKNANEVRSIASITKLMSAIVFLDSQPNLSETITVKSIRGISTRIPNNTRLTYAELLHLSLMSSDNLAAKTLAVNYPGGEYQHIRDMNVKASSLGMNNTSYTDPTGLFDTNVSTAQDLTKLIKHAENYPIVRSFSTSPNYRIAVSGKKRPQNIEFRTTNHLVLLNPDIIISKTGWIQKAGGCLVMLIQHQGHRVAVILLNSKNTQTRLRDGVLLTEYSDVRNNRNFR
jgi:D-alanyl-D-alanine endopeptidase (penicillin-binding protein 7)